METCMKNTRLNKQQGVFATAFRDILKISPAEYRKINSDNQHL